MVLNQLCSEIKKSHVMLTFLKCMVLKPMKKFM